MINFDENKMIDNGLFIYEARNQLGSNSKQYMSTSD